MKSTNSVPCPREDISVQSASRVSADPVEELRLRRWARENYVPIEFRDSTWHSVVLDEMQRKDQERSAVDLYAETARRIVPLAPDHGRILRGPHIDPVRSAAVLRVPTIE
jgi:hypothetical protein